MSWNDGVIADIRAGKPQVGGMFPLGSMLLLHTTGARSGQRRTVPLAFFDLDGVPTIMASAAGSPQDPAWFHNLVAHPQVSVERWQDGALVATEMTAEPAEGADRDALWDRIVAAAPAAADYQRDNPRTIPVIRLKA